MHLSLLVFYVNKALLSSARWTYAFTFDIHRSVHHDMFL